VRGGAGVHVRLELTDLRGLEAGFKDIGNGKYEDI
jgi:hypothetical protein